MKTPITHGTPDSQGRYEIRAGKTRLGTAHREAGSFVFRAENVDLTVGARTMKSLKERVALWLPDEEVKRIDELNERIQHPTIEDARRLTGMSHTCIKEFLKEIRLFQPQMHRQCYGGFMIRRHMENFAERDVYWARNWILNNPKVGNYRYVAPEEWAEYAETLTRQRA